MQANKVQDIKIKSRFEIFNKSEDETDIFLYGPIAKDAWWMSDDEEVINSKRVRNALKDVSTEIINIHINSQGGDVFESIAINNIFKAAGKIINCYIDGIAASGASLIAMSADKIYMPKNAVMLIHNAWTFAYGNVKDFEKVIKDLTAINTAVKESYKTRFVGTDEELTQILEDDTILTAEECYTLGLCDELIEEQKEEKQGEKEPIKNSLLKKYQAKKEEKQENQEQKPNKSILSKSILSKYRREVK